MQGYGDQFSNCLWSSQDDKINKQKAVHGVYFNNHVHSVVNTIGQQSVKSGATNVGSNFKEMSLAQRSSI